MHLTSLGFRTDVMLLALQGSSVQDHGDRAVILTPANPGYWWGNFVLFAAPPAPGDLPAWERAFTAGVPDADHRTFGVDGTSGDTETCAQTYAEFVAAGYEVDVSSVLTATGVHAPPHPNNEATYRALDLTDAADLASALAVQLANAPMDAPADHPEFLASKLDAHRALQVEGYGLWFGAFLGGQMRSGMGLFTDGSGVARFQDVDTRPDSRGQGLAGTLVHHVSRYGLDELGATTLVMVADPSYLAIDIYRSVGFTVSESQVRLERAPALRASSSPS